MIVKIKTADVYLANGRRYLTPSAACRAQARAAIKKRCDCSYESADGRYYTLACSYHQNHDRYLKMERRLARIYRAAIVRDDQPAPETLDAKAITACRNVATATAEVKRLTKIISNQLCECPEHGNHLREAYAAVNVADFEDHEEADLEYMNDKEKMAVLSACAHCCAADQSIQLRKVARHELGKARRVITNLGRKK